jgi:hypothetical protein
MPMTMKALSIRNPYAWCVVVGFKPVDNRTWTTTYRGPLLIHAGARLHDDTVEQLEAQFGVNIDRAAFQFGGIIGRVELVDVVRRHESRWFTGPFGFVFANPQPVPFHACIGRQQLFDLPWPSPL